MFKILMVNMNQALELQKVEMDSTGLAADRYKIYLQGVEAAQNKMTASWERMWMTSLNSEAVKVFYNIASALLDVTNVLGGLPTVLALVGVAFAALKWEAISGLIFESVIPAIQALGVELMTLYNMFQGGFTASTVLAEGLGALLNPAILIPVAIGAIVLAIGYFSTAAQRAADDAARATEAFKSMQSSFSQSAKGLYDLKNLGAEYEKLKYNTSRTTDENKRFLDVQNKIHDLLPSVNGQYDAQGNFILAESTNLKELIDLEQQELDIKRQKLALEASDTMKKSVELYGQQVKAIEDLTNRLNNKGPKGKANPGGGMTSEQRTALQDELKHKLLEMKATGVDIQQAYYNLTPDQQALYADTMAKLEGSKKAVMTFGDFLRSERTNTTGPAIVTVDQDAIDKGYKTILDSTVKMLKQKLNDQKDALQQEISDIKAAEATKKQIAQDTYNAEKRAIDAKKQDLQDELSKIKDIISAEKEALQAKKDEAAFNDSLAEKQKSLSDIQNQLEAVSFDTSAEGIAKKLTLQAQAAEKQKEIDTLQSDRTFNLQNKALDSLQKVEEDKVNARIKDVEDESQAAQDRYDIKIREIEKSAAAEEDARQKKIKAIDLQLSKEGALNAQAMDMIKNNGIATYQELIAWNAVYGDSIAATITDAWNAAKLAKLDYANAPVSTTSTSGGYSGGYTAGLTNQQKINSMPSEGAKTKTTPVKGKAMAFHSGIELGAVGDTGNDEFLATLARGERVFTPLQLGNLIKNLSRGPNANFSTTTGSGNISVAMPITVTGTLDQKVIPELNKIADAVVRKINENMKNRGYMRNTSMTSI
jgi:hypothetical protein